jgi:hypothetical protein
MERLGEIKRNNQGSLMKIIEYNSYADITVQFLDYPYICHSRYGEFKNGMIKNIYYPSLYGVACVGNAITWKNGKHLQSYIIWQGMIRRCYDENFQKKHPTYKNCTVDKKWLCYENFQKWYDYNYYEVKNKQDKMCLDKDIFYKNNTIYSPNTCCFVPNSINALFKNQCHNNHDISHRKYGYSIYCGRKDKTKKYIGFTTNKDEAIKLSNQARTEHLHEIVSQYENQLPYYLYRYLIEYTYEDSYNE